MLRVKTYNSTDVTTARAREISGDDKTRTLLDKPENDNLSKKAAGEEKDERVRRTKTEKNPENAHKNENENSDKPETDFHLAGALVKTRIISVANVLTDLKYIPS